MIHGEAVAAAEIMERLRARPAAARARLWAGRALLNEGRRAEAETQLSRALAFYHAASATAYVGEAEDLLEVTARPAG